MKIPVALELKNAIIVDWVAIGRFRFSEGTVKVWEMMLRGKLVTFCGPLSTMPLEPIVELMLVLLKTISDPEMVPVTFAY